MSSPSNKPLHLPPPECPSTTTTIGGPLANLSAIRTRVDSLSHLLSNSVNANTPLPKHDSDTISAELISAVHHIIINGAALITPSHPTPLPRPPPQNPRSNGSDNDDDHDFEIVELDVVDLTAENNSHTCHICGKTFKRDANLRMHMRAHGDQFKTLQSLSRPDNLKTPETSSYRRKTRFSCPCLGCNRNKNHKHFRPLKSVICVKNHFKRSHCPKKYCCSRCNSKWFSVLSDLKSHVKQCAGECVHNKCECECGMKFSTKSDLFEHMSVFEGHMPLAAGFDTMINNEADDNNDDEFGLFQNDPHSDLWSSVEELFRF